MKEMKNGKDKWIEEVVQSMTGSQRAKPRAELFAEIKEQVVASPARATLLPNWKNYAAAAVLILLINTAALILYSQNDEYSRTEKESISSSYEPINFSFQIYY